MEHIFITESISVPQNEEEINLYIGTKVDPPRPIESLTWPDGLIDLSQKEKFEKKQYFSLHHQVYEIWNLSKNYCRTGDTLKVVSRIFGFNSVNAARYHVLSHHKMLEEYKKNGSIHRSRQVGRPSIISEIHLQQVRKLIDDAYKNKELLTFTMVMRFINEKLNVVIPIETIRRIIHDRDIMQTTQAQHMEPEWFRSSYLL